MKFFSLPTLLAAALLSALTTIPFLPFAGWKVEQFHFELTVQSSAAGTAQIYYDVGHGLNEGDSATAAVVAGTPTPLRLALPLGTFKALRFDPLNRETTFTFSDAVIRAPDGHIVRRFAPVDFIAENQITRLSIAGEKLEIVTQPDANDPNLQIRLDAPFTLSIGLAENLRAAAMRGGPVFLLVLGLVWWARSQRSRGAAVWAWLTLRPVRAIMLGAVAAVVISSYPVVFMGKSIVSPNIGTILLYEDYPTLPGYQGNETSDVKGADIGAIMWAHIPLSMLEHDAVLRDGELPLWNRYNSAGTPLLGQGQSMFGDPLHCFVILANGAAWAWDLKYLTAKWLLACGLGLCVLTLTRSLPAALLVAFAADFVGFFPFRVNHPAFFSFCYAPWMLYCWLRIATAQRWTGAAWAAGALLLVNWTMLNSGTAKEAYMLLLTLNFAGAVMLLFAPLPVRERLVRFGLTAWAGLIMVLLAAPVWLTFLDALTQSYTSYNAPTAYQLQPSLALGFFDEILLRPFWEGERVYNPSLNFFLLGGVLAFLVQLRTATAPRLIRGLALAALLPLAMVFGLIPPQWIVQIPFLRNVAHLDNSFGCGLVLILAVLAGVGFATAAPRLGQPESRGDLATGGLLLFALVFPYIAFTQVVQRSSYSYLHWGETLPYSAFVWVSLIVLLLALIGFALAMRRIATRGPTTAVILVAVTCMIVMLWRHGWHRSMGFGGRVVTPMLRADFQAKSPAIAALQADQKGEPGRAAGFHGNLFPGWNDVYHLEGICGPDALMNPKYRELLDACGLNRIWDWRIYVEFPTFAALRPVYDFLNVRHYLDYKSDHGRQGSVLTPVFDGDLDVYRSETAWPRAFFTDRVATYAKPADFAQLVKGGDRRPFAAMQIGDRAIPANVPSALSDRAVAPARNYRLTTNTTAFDIEASGPGLAVLSEAWLAHDFIATLDGARVPCLRINHAFKGVMIPTSGRHHVEFTYRPARFTLSLVFSAVGIVLLGSSIGVLRRIEKRNSQLVSRPSNV